MHVERAEFVGLTIALHADRQNGAVLFARIGCLAVECVFNSMSLLPYGGEGLIFGGLYERLALSGSIYLY